MHCVHPSYVEPARAVTVLSPGWHRRRVARAVPPRPGQRQAKGYRTRHQEAGASARAGKARSWRRWPGNQEERRVGRR
ncbi:MAG: hypothetical protein OZSIB_0974 [Candidatus Ozemobacter sibiricus]|uniref:Uncharacterized protein n=1 Tax=Candidatus Ozemobacter sibiricus TaxID=2268124 RepID=A0A367ZL49_9BACT|nr:MAG: hypothetical protein OZSIB_0974 [Candidatus Ozemobacter sibiricus]